MKRILLHSVLIFGLTTFSSALDLDVGIAQDFFLRSGLARAGNASFLAKGDFFLSLASPFTDTVKTYFEGRISYSATDSSLNSSSLNLDIREFYLSWWSGVYALNVGKKIMNWGDQLYFNPVNIDMVYSEGVMKRSSTGVFSIVNSFSIEDSAALTLLCLVNDAQIDSVRSLPVLLSGEYFANAGQFMLFTKFQYERPFDIAAYGDFSFTFNAPVSLKFLGAYRYSNLSFVPENEKSNYTSNASDSLHFAELASIFSYYWRNHGMANMKAFFFFNSSNPANPDTFNYSDLYRNSPFYLALSTGLSGLLGTHLTGLQVSGLFNLTDASIAWNLYGSFEIVDGLNLFTNMDFFSGREGSEYGDFPYWFLISLGISYKTSF